MPGQSSSFNMYYLNKIVGSILNPMGIGLLLMLLSVVLLFLKKRRTSLAYGLLSIGWLWLWSTGVAGRLIGIPLEREFPQQLAEAMPQADAIVVLGGGVGINTNTCLYAKLFTSADRVWHGARLYKAGKAPKVFVTNEADAIFMADLGVPRAAITVGDSARNTEEEARFIAKEMHDAKVTEGKILLVTSAWHMRRARLMCERYASGLKVIPAASDYMNTTMLDRPVRFLDFVPDSSMLWQNAYMFKEWLAYYGYKWLRK